MRNFLNLNFKFISRSLVVAAIFFFSSQVTYAVPTLEISSSKTTVAIGENWRISGTAAGVAGCFVDGSFDTVILGKGWYPPANILTSYVDASTSFGLGSHIYTVTCYETIDILQERYTATRPIPSHLNQSSPNYSLVRGSRDAQFIEKSLTVEVVEAGGDICSTHPNSPACVLCTENESGDSCQRCAAQTQSGGDPEAGICSCATNPDQTICTTEGETLDEAVGAVDPDTSSGCIPGFGFDIKKCTITILDSTLVSLAASFLQLSAYIFEFSVQAGVVQFSALVSDDTDWLTNIWSTIRDILNIAVIFVLLYSAIQVIVGRGGEIKKLIAGVILFGVLTNFSLFLTKAAVDVSNVVALEFYNQMRTTPLSETDFEGGLGATVVSITGLTDLYTPDRLTGSADVAEKAKSPVQDSILYRLAMIFVFIAVAFVFLQATFVFIGRTISLILLMIFSPLMFAGGVFSPLQDWIKKWHKEFIGQLTVAPLFMILLYVVLTIMGSLIRAVNEKLASESGDLFSFLALVLLTSALTIFGFGAALSKAKEFSGSIGGKTVQWGNKLTGFALSGALGGALSGTGSMLRGTIGKPMRGLGNWVENSNSYVGSGLRLLGVNKLKDATLDVRNSKLAGKVGGGVSAALGAAGIDVSGVKPGAGSKTTVTTQKTIPEVYGKFKKDFQARADTRGERLVEKKLKNIEEEQNNAGIKTDNDVFDFELKHRDKDGNIVTTSRDLETDEEWLKEVKKVNQKNKSFIDSKKAEHLNNAPALAINTFGKNFLRRRGTVAEYRAQQKYAKQFKDSPEAKLKAYTDDLKKPEYRDILGVSSDQIDAMKDEEKIALWQTLGREAEKEIKDLASRLDRMEPGPDKDEMVDRKIKWGVLANKAKNASKQINDLKKKIEDSKNKKGDDKEKKSDGGKDKEKK